MKTSSSLKRPVGPFVFTFFLFLLSELYLLGNPNGTDISCIFRDQRRVFALKQEHLELRDRYHFILIPGMFSSVFKKMGGFPISYFDDYVSFFDEIGASYAVAPVNSQDGPQTNRKLIASLVSSSKRPVIMIGHSYGGLYGLSTLVHDKNLSSQVQGFVSIQAPFGGSKIAQRIYQTWFLKPFAEGILLFFGGSRQGLFEITQIRAEQRKLEWQAALDDLAQKIPMIFVTSKIDKTRFHNWFWPDHEDIDGLIESESAFWPSPYVNWAVLDGWHHMDTIGFTYDRWLFGGEQKNRRFFLSATLSALYKLLNSGG